jgi:hypothetical protein
VPDDLRARIAEALEDCRVLTPDAQADAVMAVVQPEIDRVRTYAQHYSRGRCRYCGATDPDSPWLEHQRKPHRMHCKLYVGPLKHERARTRATVLGNTRNVCVCGKEWGDEDDGCPDAGYNWRGPLPDEGGAE